MQGPGRHQGADHPPSPARPLTRRSLVHGHTGGIGTRNALIKRNCSGKPVCGSVPVTRHPADAAFLRVVRREAGPSCSRRTGTTERLRSSQGWLDQSIPSGRTDLKWVVAGSPLAPVACDGPLRPLVVPLVRLRNRALRGTHRRPLTRHFKSVRPRGSDSVGRLRHDLRNQPHGTFHKGRKLNSTGSHRILAVAHLVGAHLGEDCPASLIARG